MRLLCAAASLIAAAGCLVSDTQLGDRPDLSPLDAPGLADAIEASTPDGRTPDGPTPAESGLDLARDAAPTPDGALDAPRPPDGATDARRDLTVGDTGFPPPPDALPDGLLLGDGPLLGCGPVTFTGCCRNNVLYYCHETGLLLTANCSRQPQCGWDEVRGFYDCGTDGAGDPAGTHPKPCGF